MEQAVPRSSDRAGFLPRPRSCVLVLLAACAALGADQGLPPSFEYQIKADFVYTVAKFVEWPAARFAAPEAPLVFCVLGEDPFGQVLEETIAGKTVGGRPVSVRRLDRSDDLEACHLLFVGAREGDRIPEAVNHLDGAGVLTVGETERFAQSGGIMNLGLRENMVQFEVNVEVAERAGLHISSKILKLGRVVRTKHRGPKDLG